MERLHNVTTRMVRIEDLRPTPDEINPNKMTLEEQRMLNQAWAANVGLQPILITPRFVPGDGFKYTVVDGEHRRRAAVANGDEEIEAVQGVFTDVALLRVGMNKNRGDVDINVAKVILRDLIEDGYTPLELIVTGFNEEEINDMVNETSADTTAVLGALDTTLPTVADKPHVLEIPFANVAQFKTARSALKKAAGATKDLGLGLLNLIGSIEEGEDE